MTATVRLEDNGVTVGFKLTATTQTTLYTIPNQQGVYGKGVSLTLCNVDGTSAVDITIEWTDNSASTTYKLLSTHSIPADSTIIFDLGGMKLDAGDAIKATASAANDVEGVLSLLLSPGRQVAK